MKTGYWKLNVKEDGPKLPSNLQQSYKEQSRNEVEMRKNIYL